jgi:HupE / UreJ protein
VRRSGHPIGRTILLLLLFILGVPGVPLAHEIPPRVTVLAFVKAEESVLRVLLRVPLEAIRDVEFPLRQQVYLDVERAGPMLNQAATTWIAEYLTLYENDDELSPARVSGARISLPGDRSFASYGDALAHLRAAPLALVNDLPWQQALLDVSLEYPITSAGSRFSIRPALAHLGVRTATSLRFVTANGAERAFRYEGDPGIVRLDPRWHQAALGFVRLGLTHILGGIDHLLFVLCLVIPIRRLRPLVGVVTAFTVAHSITLAASVTGFAPDASWFPPLIELLVAISILYMALENIAGVGMKRRWMLAFGFGLVHGFAFSFALRDSMQFAGSHLATSLLAFNIGVEAGQVLVLCVAAPLLSLLFRRVVPERMGMIVLSALVAHTAWHWMVDRGSALGAYRVAWPALDASFVASAMRMMIVAIVAALAMWLMSLAGKWLSRSTLDPGVEGSR